MTEARVPVTDDALVEKVARAIDPDAFVMPEPDTLAIAAWQGRKRRAMGKAREAIAIAYPAGVAAGREEAQADIVRLRGLLIDPGNPAWEDARAVLVAELRKHGMVTHADNIEAAHGVPVPSWIALNLIAHAAKSAAIRQRGE